MFVFTFTKCRIRQNVVYLTGTVLAPPGSIVTEEQAGQPQHQLPQHQQMSQQQPAVQQQQQQQQQPSAPSGGLF